MSPQRPREEVAVQFNVSGRSGWDIIGWEFGHLKFWMIRTKQAAQYTLRRVNATSRPAAHLILHVDALHKEEAVLAHAERPKSPCQTIKRFVWIVAQKHGFEQT